MMRRTFPLLLLALLLLPFAASAQEVTASLEKKDGVFDVGQAVVWKVAVKGNDAASVKEAAYAVKKGGLTVIKEGKLDLSSGSVTVESKLDEPGTLLLEVKTKVGGKDVKSLAGAAIAPTKIGVSAPPPDDFDAFWAAKLKELADVPANVKLEPGESGKPNVEYAKVTMDNIRGSHIYAQVAKPKKEGKFPALLIVQYAGVYGLPKSNVVNRAEQGWLALNVIAHDIPFDQPEQFYKDQSAGPLKDYMSIGTDDRDKSYFLRMYLSCYRAADYLASREDWDGRTLVVMGTSQGGQQSFVTAGIHPKITAMIANVPAGCDVTGPRIGRSAGFPYWADRAKWQKNDKIVEVGRYYDAVNFAARAKCPGMVSMGLIDETCPPAGVLAACNVMKGPVERIILPESDHKGVRNSQAAFYKKSEEWLRTLVKGESAAGK